jgi:hypothetical protein
MYRCLEYDSNDTRGLRLQMEIFPAARGALNIPEISGQ